MPTAQTTQPSTRRKSWLRDAVIAGEREGAGLARVQASSGILALGRSTLSGVRVGRVKARGYAGLVAGVGRGRGKKRAVKKHRSAGMKEA